MMFSEAKGNNYFLNPNDIIDKGVTQKGKHRYTANIKNKQGMD